METMEILRRHYEMLLGANKSGDELTDLAREEECIDAWHCLLREKGCELIYVADLRAGKVWATDDQFAVPNPITMDSGDFNGGDWAWPVFIVVPQRVLEELSDFPSGFWKD